MGRNYTIMFTRGHNCHSKIFETPKELPPIFDHDHVIHFIPESVPPNIMPYTIIIVL